MALEPTACEGAGGQEGQAVTSRRLDGCLSELPADAPAAERLGHLGVQQDQTVGAPAVYELGDCAIDGQLEARVGAAVDYPLVLVHATIVASRGPARATARLIFSPRSAQLSWQQDFRSAAHEPSRPERPHA